MKTISKKPTIRFKNYKNDWEQRKLGDISTSYSGGTPTANNKSYYGGEIPFIRSGEISKETTELFITELAVRNSSAKMVNNGDILYAMYGATSGEVSISKINGAINQAVLAIIPLSGYKSKFIEQQLKLKKSLILSTYLQGGQGNLSASIIKNIFLNFPAFEEQQLIGSFFKELDNLITLYQCKLNHLELAKNTFLNMMFPKKDANFPEFRFAKYNDVWEQRKLEDIADRYDNLRIPVTASNRIPGSTPYYGANGIQDYVDGYTHDGEYVLIAEDGANDLNNYPVHLVKGKVWVNNHAHVISAIDNIANNLFVSNSFKTLNLVPYLTGGSRAKLNAETMMKLNLKIPSIEEQQFIGAFFESLDNLITLHHRKLERLENIKKYYLKHMFV